METPGRWRCPMQGRPHGLGVFLSPGGRSAMPPTTKRAAHHSPSPHTPWAPPRRRKRARGACCRFIYCACCPCKQTARLHRHGGAILSRVAALSQPNFATARSTLARSQFSDAGQCWCQLSSTACTCVGKESLSATLPEPPSPCHPIDHCDILATSV